ncbi:MAG: PepSY-associated TM helix domain-containing protein [Bacteroidota bacterium]
MDTPHPPTASPPRLGTEADAPAQGKAPGKKTKKLVGPRAFKLLWDSHSVVGIVVGLGLFVIFYAGAFSLYRAELIAWADPALRAAEVRISADEAVAPILAEAPPAPATDVQVSYPVHERAYYYVRYQTPHGDTTRAVQAMVNAETGQRFDIAEGEGVGRSQAGNIVYRLHYFAQAGFAGQVISGLVAVFLLFAVVSGILIHLRKLPTDWHTFRPKVRLRSALADAHTVLGLVGLPFAAMYAITGAFLALLIILLAPSVIVVFGGDQEAALDLVYGFEMPPHEPTGEPAEMLSMNEIMAALPDSWEAAGVEPTFALLHGWGDEAAIAEVFGDTPNSLTAGPRAILDASTGEVLAANNPTLGTALGGTTAAITNLHYARLGGGTTVAKVLYFWLALATASVILTGNILWVLVRRPKDPRATPRLHRFLARLTVGVGCGLVVAVPIIFLVPQVLGIEAEGLVTWENAVFFGAWAVFIVAAFAGPSAVWAARWQLAMAGVLSLLVPVASATLGGTPPWVSAANEWWGLVTIDVGFVLMGLALLWTARRLGPASLTPALSGDGAAAEPPLAPQPVPAS